MLLDLDLFPCRSVPSVVNSLCAVASINRFVPEERNTDAIHFPLALASWCATRGKMHKIGRVFSQRDSALG